MTELVDGETYLHRAKYHGIGGIERTHADYCIFLIGLIACESSSIVAETVDKSKHELQFTAVLYSENLDQPIGEIQRSHQIFAGTHSFFVDPTLGLEEFIELRLGGKLPEFL